MGGGNMLSSIALLVVACTSPEPDDTDDLPWDPRFDAVAAAAQADLAESGAVAVSVAIMEDGRVTFAAAFGTVHPDSDEPVTPETLFQIGSTTKQMTAATVLQKVDEGLLSLDDTLGDAIPALEFALGDAWDDEITLHHLLSHQSALYDWLPWTVPGTADTLLETWATTTFAANEFAMNPPGLFYNYSNPAYSLAALAVQNADERYWPDIIEQDLFAPLGMDRTFARRLEAVADGDMAIGVGTFVGPTGTPLYGTVEATQIPDHPFIRPAGLVWTTPTQLLTWSDFVMNGNPGVLSDALREQITTPHAPLLFGPPEADQAYGYGMFVWPGFFLGDDYYEVPRYDHGGATLSYTATLDMLPEQGFAIAVLASGESVDLDHTVRTALETLPDLPDPVAEPPEHQWDPDRLDDHVGTYFDGFGVGEMIITRVEDDLQVEMPYLDQVGYVVTPELEPINDTLFVMWADPIPFALYLTFIGEPGEPSQYVRNRLFVTARVEESAR